MNPTKTFLLEFKDIGSIYYYSVSSWEKQGQHDYMRYEYQFSKI